MIWGTVVRDNSDGRLRGRKLQETRLRIWAKDPCCAMCRRLTEYPSGFDLDHKIPLFKQGSNDDGNLQVLCKGPDGCHDKKTRTDLGIKSVATIGIDGFPVEKAGGVSGALNRPIIGNRPPP